MYLEKFDQYLAEMNRLSCGLKEDKNKALEFARASRLAFNCILQEYPNYSEQAARLLAAKLGKQESLLGALQIIRELQSAWLKCKGAETSEQ